MTTTPAFIHLRLHSEYSIADGIVRIDKVIEKAAVDNMPALALTDLANLFGMVKFYQAARSHGIKPIIGCDVWISNATNRDQPSRLLLLCQSYAGYLLLSRLLSRAYRENQYRGHAEIDPSWFGANEYGTDGLIALSSSHHGNIGMALMQGQNSTEVSLMAQTWHALFPGRFYIEIQRAGHAGEAMLVQQSVALAAALRLPVVATQPVQFLEPDDYKAHEARVCIAQGNVLGDPRRPRHFTAQQYFKTCAEMAALFADIPSALTNSIEIAKRCNLSLELGVNRLPLFPTGNNESLEQCLHRQALAGLEARMQSLFPDDAERQAQTARYRARLDFEASTIVQMGFAGYFLIVANFINWAKQNQVPVGPGRGSGAGSLVAYSLGITDLDPLRYDLLFERFLNPERVSMPDFDIDFCQDGREHVIEYVKQTYGEESVSQIVTFGTMAAKAVIRDVGRVLDLPYNFVDQLAKLIPFELGMTLERAYKLEPQLHQRAENEEEVRELLELAGRLEGITRNVGMHAGGVLIAPGKITDFCPVYCAGPGESVVSQLDKDDIEKIGLVKFDFLGLRTLTILDWSVRYIRQRHVVSQDTVMAETFSLEALPLDDPDTYALMRQGNTAGIFQFESRGMIDLLKKARPDRFEDIIALVALYRPGPMDLIPDFIERKHGNKRVEFPDPRLQPILGPTYGVMVYQEQVMQIAQVIGGYSLGSADLLRRAMGKKKVEEMAQQRDIFVAGATSNGVPSRKAEELFSLMEKFAGYGFNKSHAAAYALIAFQTAWLKAHYPAEFMAATLSADMDDTDKVHAFVEDSLANGLIILPPDINQSDYRFVPVYTTDRKTLRYGLGAVKGTGESAIAAIVRAREEGGFFTSLFDFCHRTDKRIVNRRAIESLIRAGAFDTVTPDRASLMASVSIAMESAGQAGRDINQVSLFEETPSAAGPIPLAEVPAWSDKERLIHEKSALGFYLSGHPFDTYAAELQQFVRTRLDRLQLHKEPQLLAGIVSSVRTQMTRRGKMGVVVLDDGHARAEVVVFNELFESLRDWLKEDALLVVEAKVSTWGNDDQGGFRITANKLYNLVTARNQFAKNMILRCNGNADAARLSSLLAPYCCHSKEKYPENQTGDGQSGCPVFILHRNHHATCTLELGTAWQVSLEDRLLQDLATCFSPENVRITY